MSTPAASLPSRRPALLPPWLVQCPVPATGALAAALFLAAGTGAIPVPVALAIHAATVVVATAVIAAAPGGVPLVQALGLLMVAVAGPVGAAGYLSLAKPGTGGGPRVGTGRGLAWPEDGAAALADAIRAGRVAELGRTRRRSLLPVMREGTLCEQQAVLGLVALRDRPELAPLLAAGLVSRKPAIRAQAAAILARQRDREARGLAHGAAGAQGR
jgi:hypothetical protein